MCGRGVSRLGMESEQRWRGEVKTSAYSNYSHLAMKSVSHIWWLKRRKCQGRLHVLSSCFCLLLFFFVIFCYLQDCWQRTLSPHDQQTIRNIYGLDYLLPYLKTDSDEENKSTGVQVSLRKLANQPPLPSIIQANVQSQRLGWDLAFVPEGLSILYKDRRGEFRIHQLQFLQLTWMMRIFTTHINIWTFFISTLSSPGWITLPNIVVGGDICMKEGNAYKLLQYQKLCTFCFF